MTINYMNSSYIDTSSKLIAIDFDPFGADQLPLIIPEIAAQPEMINSMMVHPHRCQPGNTNGSEPPVRLTAIDFDPFIDGEIDLTVPATESQQEIWLGVQLSDQANLACILSQSFRLTGLLNIQVLQAAFDRLIKQHESLRATFSGDGMTMLIAKQIEFNLPIIDLADLADLAQAIEVEKYHQQSLNQVFDLNSGPLFSVKLIKLANREYLVILTIHHIICDGWSLGTIGSDLAKIYTDLHQGTSPELAPPEYFSEYACVERAKIGSSAAIAVEAYWLNRFADLPPVLDIPTDYPRPPIKTFNSGCENYPLPASLVKGIEQLGIKHGCSLMTTLLAGFEVFLSKITGQTDLVIGVPTSGQLAVGKYNLVGHCVNFLPMRSLVDPACKFSEYLRSRNSSILDDYEHQDFTLGSLLKKLSVPRDPSRTPLVAAAFNVDLDPGNSHPQFDQLEVELIVNPSAFTTFEFLLNAANHPNGDLHLDCQYHTNLFSAATIHRHLVEFETLLTQIVADPDRSISKLSLLNPAAEQQLLVAWNHTQTNYPATKCIQQLFEEQVELNGDRIALVFGQQQLTYHELNHRANQLANYLRTLGIKPDQLIGIATNRSLETIISMLGILKAGGAYLPLDLAYPAERLSFMLDDAQVSILLTQAALVERLPPHQTQILCLDADWDKIAKSSSANPHRLEPPDCLAYVMYTSGSTGQPKGVCVTHQGVVRLVKATDYADFSSDQIFLQLATISFDAATFEIWGSLLNGAKLVLFPGHKPSLAELGQIVREQQITTLFLTAGLFPLVVDEQLANLASLRQLVIGGDVVSVAHAQKVRSTLTDCRLINGYGPTENTTFTCCHTISITDSLLTSVPIGRPIANTQVYILDPDLQPVPIGITGELYTGGAGLARGYLNRPELTRAKFIPHPFATAGQLYRTGDLARYLPDGTIEFLGRIDRQVKIRGFRIELGEIETVLSQYPSIRDVSVIDLQDRPGDKRLVAYLVTHPPGQPTERELRAFLQSKLPEYLIPSAFVTIAALPLMLNGKIDRRALPAPEYSRPASANTLIPPRDQVELQLTQIWERLLDVQPIGIRDNFFELGGHSLIAVRLFAEISQTWARNLPLASLFQQQTIEELAVVLREEAWSASWSSLVLIRAGGQQPPLFCIHPVGGNVLEYYALANYLDRSQPVYGLQSLGLDGTSPPLRRVEDMAHHYIQEIRTIQPHGPYFLTGYSFGGLVAFEMAQQLIASGEQIALLAILDCNAPNLPNLRPSFLCAVGIHLRNLWQLEPKERSSYIGDRLAYRFNSENERDFLAQSLYNPDDLTPQLLTILDANLEASEDYIAQAYPARLTLFRCQVQDLEHYLHPDFGWGKLVDENLDLYPIPGPHFNMLKEPRVRVLAAQLDLCLKRLQTE